MVSFGLIAFLLLFIFVPESFRGKENEGQIQIDFPNFIENKVFKS
jgi:hypothetical protein|tara:strand:+ start:1245 stop:1379 length:135 start_codon:yes stop_codon:yes gene_type:complete